MEEQIHKTRILSGSRNKLPQFGSQVLPDGSIRFSLWAPTANDVQLCLYGKNNDKSFVKMDRGADSWYFITTEKAGIGDAYSFYIDKHLLVPDPASRMQLEDVHGPSVVVNPEIFNQPSGWKGRPWKDAVIYELHVGTFTEEGTFDAIIHKLDYLRDLGVTAIELMPIADFPGKYNWGYDGVLWYAPDRTYGKPTDLRRLIEEAHSRDLMVFLDVVYNHFGPDGNYLYCYAKDFFNEKHHTPWGGAINFDGKNSEFVRRFVVENALYWIEDYGFDGLRFDAVHEIYDDSPHHILTEISEAIERGPGRERHVHLILENDDNRARYIATNEQKKTGFYTAQWNDDIHHALHVIATGEDSGYYSDYTSKGSGKSAIGHLARCLAQGFAYQGERSIHRDGRKRGEPSAHLPPTSFIAFTQNHDQIGNRAFGERISDLCKQRVLDALNALLLLSPQVPMLFQGQEWNSKSPFNFFCDLSEDLKQSITDGRRNEFAKFPEFQDERRRKLIPDPCTFRTFEKSKLIWLELHVCMESFNQFSSMLRIRQEEIVPLLDCAAEASILRANEDGTVVLTWDFPDAKLSLIANLSNRPKTIDDELKIHLATSKIIYATARKMMEPNVEQLPPWSVIWCKANVK